MTEATRLVSQAAGEAVQNIPELYEGYHAELVRRFVKVLRLQHDEIGERTRRTEIDKLVKNFANEVRTQRNIAQ